MELSITKVNGFESFGSLAVSKMEYFLSITVLKNSYILDIGVLDPPIFDTGIRGLTFSVINNLLQNDRIRSY